MLAAQLGVPLPAVPLLLAAGAIAGTGHLDLATIAALSLLASLAGDSRSLKSGMNQGAGASPVGREATGAATGSLEEGYCTFASGGGFNKGMLSGWKNGEIHVAMHVMQELGYSDDAFARVIIHEAAHKYLGVTDKLYAHQGGYDALPFTDCIDNADSYAWAALSLDAGHLIKGLHSTDAAAFTAPIA